MKLISQPKQLFIWMCILFTSGTVFAQDYTNISPFTGWPYNYTTTRAFKKAPKINPNGVPSNMVYVTGGTVTIDNNLESVTVPTENARKRLSVNAFFMDKYEVSIASWREYVNWLKLVYGKLAPQMVEKALPNEKSFFDDITFNDPFLKNYFNHPAFEMYPIVGVSWEQAYDYCTWRTDRVNELALIQAGVIPAPDYKKIQAITNLDTLQVKIFETKRFLERGNYLNQDKRYKNSHLTILKGLMVPNFRLPTEDEWEFAAYAINPYLATQPLKAYPWITSNYNLLTKEQQLQLFANYRKGSGYLLEGEKTSRTGSGILPANSYYPNDFGIYNLAGNVNEWVADDYIIKAGQTQIDSIDVLDVYLPSYNHESRIYKGGSWKDGIFWINPASRRFLNQKTSAGDLGFRCVMSVPEYYSTVEK